MSVLHRWMAHWDRPAAPALTTSEGTRTQAELLEAVRRAATWLEERGIGRGDVVALQMTRTPAFLDLHLAALGLGATTLPLNDRYTPHELAHPLRDAAPKLAVTCLADPGALEGEGRTVRAEEGVAAELAACRPHALPEVASDEDIAVLCYTSGTTGVPKGAEISHGNLAATVEALHGAWRWAADDVLLHALPLHHIHGLFVAQHGALRAGAHTVWAERFRADDVLARLGSQGITVFMGVPTFYARLLALSAEDDPDLSGMRLFTSGSAPLPAPVHRAFAERFGHAIVERYGMTEVGIVLSNPYDGDRRPGSVGFPLPGVRAEIRDPETDAPCPAGTVGELRISGPSVVRGYRNLPDATRAALRDGWMRTGDLCFVDDDGYHHLVGRSSELILSGGFNVYPLEIEGCIAAVPGVEEVAVVGLPDDDLGELVTAAVVAAEGWDRAALDRCVSERLAPYKRPRRVARVDALPRNAMGKVQKAVLRSQLILHYAGAPEDP